MPQPPLVQVSGASGRGKSTSAELHAGELHLLRLMKDAIKGTLADTLGGPAPAAGERLSGAAFQVLCEVARRPLLADAGAVAEGDFFEVEVGVLVRPSLPLNSPVLVHCHADHAVAIERYKTRYRQGHRHAVRHDLHVIAGLDGSEITKSWNESKPLNLGILSLVVNTTDQYDPPVANVTAFVRQATGQAA